MARLKTRYAWAVTVRWLLACQSSTSSSAQSCAADATDCAANARGGAPGSGGSTQAGTVACVPRDEVYDAGTQFPYVPTTAAVPYPDCTPTCGAGQADFQYLEALPAGECTGEPTCQMGVRIICPCGDWGPVNGYICGCVAGRWSCTLAYPGGNTCLTPPSDCRDL
jgi:hypothetical protein